MADARLRMVTGTNLADSGSAVLGALDRVRVIIRPGASSPANVVAVSLAARLFAHVELSADRDIGLPGLPATLDALLNRLSWLRPTAAAQPAVDRVLAVGPTTADVDLGVGGGAWTVRVGREPQPLDSERGPALGLRVAAAIAVGELVKEALGPLGWITHHLGSTLVWNLLDYQLRPAPEASLVPLRSRELVVAGVGSVGTTLVAALVESDVDVLHGTFIDPECFDDRNPFRYPALLDDCRGLAKVDWAEARFAEAGVQVAKHHGDVASWVRAQPNPGLDGILVASPDSVAGRRDVADVLARATITVGVSGMAFHVARHHLGDGLVCPYCQCVPLGPATTQAGVYAAQTGLPIERVLQLLQPGAVLSDADLVAVRASGHLPGVQTVELAGHRLTDLIARLYAEAQVPASSSADTETVALAAPHVSLIAGTLAAAEVRKHQLGLPMVDRRMDLDLTGLPQGLVRRPPADATGRCLCASPFRRRWTKRMYPPAA